MRGRTGHRIQDTDGIPARRGDVTERTDDPQARLAQALLQHAVEAILGTELMHDAFGAPGHPEDPPPRVAGCRGRVLGEHRLVAAVKGPDAEVHDTDRQRRRIHRGARHSPANRTGSVAIDKRGTGTPNNGERTGTDARCCYSSLDSFTWATNCVGLMNRKAMIRMMSIIAV